MMLCHTTAELPERHCVNSVCMYDVTLVFSAHLLIFHLQHNMQAAEVMSNVSVMSAIYNSFSLSHMGLQY